MAFKKEEKKEEVKVVVKKIEVPTKAGDQAFLQSEHTKVIKGN